MAAQLADYGVQYGVQKRQLGRQRDATLAQNAYSRFLAQQRGSRAQFDLSQNFSRGYERVGASMGQRGLRNSGIAQNADAQYRGDYARQKTRTDEDMWNALQQYQMSDQLAWDNYNSGAADIDLLKNANILSTAAQLESFKPFLGS